MTKFVYSGNSKQYRAPLKRKHKQLPIFTNMAFILCGSHPINGFKVNGSNLLYKYNNSEILEYQLDIIHSLCKNPEIVVISGIDHGEFIKHDRRNEFILIENQLYEFSNSAEDLKIGLNAIRSPNTIFIDSGFIPTVETFNLLLKNKEKFSKIIIKPENADGYVGVNIGSHGFVSNFTFSVDNTITGMYYISQCDIDKLRKRSITKKFTKNKFAFEVLSEIKLKALLDESKSKIIVR